MHKLSLKTEIKNVCSRNCACYAILEYLVFRKWNVKNAL